MTPGVQSLLRDLGLYDCPMFYRDTPFMMALLAGGGYWLGLWMWVPVQPMAGRQILWWRFISLVLWQPVVEEVLFRGILQGQMRRQIWGRRDWHGVSVANGMTSCLFVLGHWISHPPHWAAAVMIPSLIFGYFRDRYQSVYPSITLHGIYNAGYFLLTGIPK